LPEGYGSVTSLLALNFFPDPEAAVQEMRSVTARQGIVSACVWDYGGRMEFLRTFWDAVTSLDSSAGALDEGKRFPLCQPDALVRVFRSAGLADIRCEAIEIPTAFASFEDYWQPFLGGTGPAPSYFAGRRAPLAAGANDRRGPAAGTGWNDHACGAGVGDPGNGDLRTPHSERRTSAGSMRSARSASSRT
jgi:hypothetical protein